MSVPDDGYSIVPDDGYSIVPDDGYSRSASCALILIFTFFFISHTDLINVMRYRVTDPAVGRSLCHVHVFASLHMAAVFNIGFSFERNLQDLSENFNKLHTFHKPLFPYFAYLFPKDF